MKKIIEVDSLSYFYPGTEKGIEDIKFDVEEGDVVGIIGANGSGKTTLLFSVCGLLKVRGKVVIDGIPLSARNFNGIREKIGFVFQDPDDQLFMPVVFQDVGFTLFQKGLPEDFVLERVREVLKMVGLEGFEERESHKLSYGEKKKVCIAGAIIHEPKILILDEPTAWLDPRGRRELLEIIKGIGKTTIIAGHDLEFIDKISNKIMVLENGRMIAFSHKEEILKNPSILKRVGFE